MWNQKTVLSQHLLPPDDVSSSSKKPLGSQSVDMHPDNNHSAIVMSDHEPEPSQEPPDVLSDSEYGAQHNTIETYFQQRPIPLPNIDDVDHHEDEHSDSQHTPNRSNTIHNISLLLSRSYKEQHTHDDSDELDDGVSSNKSLPLNIDSHSRFSQTTKHIKASRSKSLHHEFLEQRPSNSYPNQVRASQHNLTETVTLSPPRYDGKSKKVSKQFRPRQNEQDFDDELPVEALLAQKKKKKSKRARRGGENRQRQFVESETVEKHKEHHSQQTSHFSQGYAQKRVDGAIESDYTSMASDDHDDRTYYYAQIRRWRQIQRCLCCCRCQCCLEGSSLWKFYGAVGKWWSRLIYYKWCVLWLVLLIVTVCGSVYAFETKAARQNVNDYINQHVLSAEKQVAFDEVLCARIFAVLMVLMLLLNLYMVYSFYRLRKVAGMLEVNVEKCTKQIERGRQRREVIKIQRQYNHQLYVQMVGLWNQLLVKHENFPIWIKTMIVNVNKIANLVEAKQEEVGKYVSNLQKIHSTLKVYNSELVGLILKKLKYDIEDNIDVYYQQGQKQQQPLDETMPVAEFNNFVKKVPRQYRHKFEQLKSANCEHIEYNDIYCLLTNILETYGDHLTAQKLSKLSGTKQQSTMEYDHGILQGITVTSDRLSNEPASISNLYGGYLHYGDDNNAQDLSFRD